MPHIDLNCDLGESFGAYTIGMDEEVDSIKRWARTKNGKDELIIVKKIPFAFFINIGYAIFMIIGGYKLWLGT